MTRYSELQETIPLSDLQVEIFYSVMKAINSIVGGLGDDSLIDGLGNSTLGGGEGNDLLGSNGGNDSNC